MAHVTTPFGRRPMTLALVKAQMDAVNAPPERIIDKERTIDKWQVLRDICDARTRLKLRDRALAVLSALLSFHPEAGLSSADNLIVFPSNAQLSARANGIAGTTLRENLAILVQAGIVLRHDSPNGKRYARKSSSGRIQTAYGFSLSPLVTRAAEFAELAQDVAAERRHLAILRERITLLRRDIRKLVSIAQEKDSGDRDGDELSVLEMKYAAFIADISRSGSLAELAVTERGLADLKKEVINHLAIHWKLQKADGNADEIRCHIQNQNTESLIESEHACEKERGCNVQMATGLATAGRVASADRPLTSSGTNANPFIGTTSAAVKILPLGLVVRSCPEIVAYGPKGRIETWRELMSAAVVVRSMLGIGAGLYQEACEAMGPEHAAATIACLLERAGHISSPGAYLRTLIRKAGCGKFSPASMLMALAKKRGG